MIPQVGQTGVIRYVPSGAARSGRVTAVKPRGLWVYNFRCHRNQFFTRVPGTKDTGSGIIEPFDMWQRPGRRRGSLGSVFIVTWVKE